VVKYQIFNLGEAIEVGWFELSFTVNSKTPFRLSPHCSYITVEYIRFHKPTKISSPIDP